MTNKRKHRELNPIIVKGMRARLRRGPLLSWSVVVLTITGFVSAIVYLVNTEQGFLDPRYAAQVTLLPVIIIQAIILMLLGTGAVASGISQERDKGLLDYQRMTPMSPTSKLLGYLFGLPAREYVLFALTLPFMAFGIIKGGFPLATIAKFYVIFFSSVMVYHMTGMAAGMVSSKPRRAGLIAQGMVLMLYFVLPTLSFFGFTFFEFLTIRPALIGMVYQEIQNAGASPEAVAQLPGLTSLDEFRYIPFFNTELHPITFTLIAQAGLLITLWTAVHRKWRDDANHEFSKWFGLVFFAGAATMTLGNVWPILRDNEVFVQLLRQFMGDRQSAAQLLVEPESPILTTVVLTIALAILTGLCVLTLLCITPSNDKVKQGWRRVARQGGRHIPLSWDSCSSIFVTMGIIVLYSITFGLLAYAAYDSARYIEPPAPMSLIMPAAYMGMVIIFLQATLERYGKRSFFVATFLLWMVPFFSATLIGAAFERQLLASYVSLPFPPAGLFFSFLDITFPPPFENYENDGPPVILIENARALITAGTIGYAVLAGVMLTHGSRHHNRLRNEVMDSVELVEAA
ncbi:MAG: hypothetical protein ACYTF7_06935 [Planctomycetota bacterium]|jgi:hypothetical protein